MWGRSTFKSSVPMYSSTPHLFVYQPCDEDEVETEPSDSGYADSMRSGGTSSSARGGGSPEPIYCSALEMSRRKQAQELDAIERLNQYTHSDDEQQAANDHMQLTDLEMTRVETFFRGHQTEVFVGKSLASLYVRTAKSLVGLNRCSSQPDICTRTLQRQENSVSSWQLKSIGIPVSQLTQLLVLFD